MNISYFKFPFSQENWLRPSLMYLGLIFLSFSLSYGFQFGGAILSVAYSDSSSASAGELVAVIGQLFGSLISIPLGIYAQGYILEIAMRRAKGEESVLPRISDWKTKLSLGGSKLIASFLIMIFIFILAGIIVTITTLFVVAIGGYSGGLSALAIFATVLAGFLGFVLFVLLSGFFLPSMIGLYMITNKIDSMFKFGQIFQLMRNSWIGYLKMAGLGILLSIPVLVVGGVFFGIIMAIVSATTAGFENDISVVGGMVSGVIGFIGLAITMVYGYVYIPFVVSNYYGVIINRGAKAIGLIK